MNRFVFLKTAVALVALTFPVLSFADTRNVLQGNTALTIDTGFETELRTLGITLTINKPATLTGSQAVFPVIGGEIDLATALGEVFHGGGMTLTKGATSVNLINFILDTTARTPDISAAFVDNATLSSRAPLFDIQLPVLTLPLVPTPPNNLVMIQGIAVTLSSRAARALNSAFSTSAFSSGFTVGKATTAVAVGAGKQ